MATAVRWRLAGIVLGVVVLAAACGSGEDDAEDVPRTDPLVEEADESDGATVGADCSPRALGEDDEIEVLVANVVVEGELGQPCLGDEDPTLVEAWDVLASIVPAEQLASLELFAGFGTSGDGDEVTVAFVNLVSLEPRTFQMSVNLDEAAADPDELTLTMVHEVGHVITQLPDELDVEVDPEDCGTFHNGDGCFVEGSIMDEWITTFWSEDDLLEVDPFDVSAADGEERCSLDDGFFGPYAASSPEEDFAEALSAFVLGVPADSEGQQERYDLLATFDEVLEQQERADEAGLSPLPNEFEACG